MKPLRIIFAGTPAFGIHCLEAISTSGHDLVAVYTQPDRPAGRGRHFQVSAVKEWASNHQIPIYQPVHFKDAQTTEELKTLRPDVIVVIAYGLILPLQILQIPNFGCINVHASLLPQWRGASPIQHALLHGDTKTGVTIMQMNVGMDTGDMLKKVEYTVTHRENAASLHDQLSIIAVKPLLEILNSRASTQPFNSTPQNNTIATYAPKISKEDARIDWEQSALEIDQQIRAFNPWPIAYTQFHETVVRVHQARVIDAKYQHLPGTVVEIDKSGITVVSGSQCILIERLQFPGGKVISVADWINAGSKHLSLQSVVE